VDEETQDTRLHEISRKKKKKKKKKEKEKKNGQLLWRTRDEE